MTFPPWMQERVEQLGWVLVHFCWQGVLLGGALWLVRAIMRKQSARSRYAVLCFGLAACALAPCVTWVVISKSTAPRPTAGVVNGGVQAAAPAAVRPAMESGPTPILLPASIQHESHRWDWASFSDRIQVWLPSLVKIWAAGVLLLGFKFLYG